MCRGLYVPGVNVSGGVCVRGCMCRGVYVSGGCMCWYE